MRTRTLAFPFPRTLLAVFVATAALGAFSIAALLVRAQSVPTVETTIRNESNATTTSAAIGSVVHAQVELASTTATSTPQGTVDFRLYPTNTSCTGTSTVQAGVPLVNGVATSSTTTVPATGLSYQVHYNGQQGVYDPVDGSCAPLVATAPNVELTTTLSTTTIVAGESAYDTAVLQNATAAATGTVAYKVYSNSSCTTLALDAGTTTVTNSVVPNSLTWQFITPGTYYWQALYSGDQFNSAATSTCTSEILTVIPTSTPPATGTIIVDKVTTPSATSTSFHFTTTGSGYASFNLTDQASPNSQTLATGTYAVSEDTMSGWKLDSAMCSVNGVGTTTYTPGTNFTLGAGNTIRCTFRNSTTTAPTPGGGEGSISGMKYHDLDRDGSKDAGESGLSGWTINLYGEVKKNGQWWHGLKLGFWAHESALKTTTTDANGNYSFTELEDGTYYVREGKRDGWRQVSRNPGPVTIENGSDVTGIDFGNVEKGSGKGDNKDDKDKKKKERKERGHNDDDDDEDEDEDGDEDDDNNGDSDDLRKSLGSKINAKVRGLTSDILDIVFNELGMN